MKIVRSRLEGVPGDIVDPDAVQFASRKVAAVSGDARRALDICRRAVELAEADSRTATSSNPPTPSKRMGARAEAAEQQQQKKKGTAAAGRVTIETVRRAISEATSNPLQLYLRALPFASRLLLSALSSRAQRSGLAEGTYGDVLEETRRMLKLAEDSRPLALLESMSARLEAGGTTFSSFQKARYEPRAARPGGMGRAAVDLAGAGIINLEGQKAIRAHKIRLAVADEEIRMAFRDDPEMKSLGMIL